MSWKFALINILKDETKLLYSDSEIAIAADCFPKSEVHYLVLPKQNIPSIKDVNRSHIELLKKMDLTGREFARENNTGRKFMYVHFINSLLIFHDSCYYRILKSNSSIQKRPEAPERADIPYLIYY